MQTSENAVNAKFAGPGPNERRFLRPVACRVGRRGGRRLFSWRHRGASPSFLRQSSQQLPPTLHFVVSTRKGLHISLAILSPPFERHLTSYLDGLGCAEHPSRTIFGPHGDVRVQGSHRHGRLESVSRNRSQRLQMLYPLACEYFPARDLRGAVPACVDSCLLLGSTL